MQVVGFAIDGDIRCIRNLAGFRPGETVVYRNAIFLSLFCLVHRCVRRRKQGTGIYGHSKFRVCYANARGDFDRPARIASINGGASTFRGRRRFVATEIGQRATTLVSTWPKQFSLADDHLANDLDHPP